MHANLSCDGWLGRQDWDAGRPSDVAPLVLILVGPLYAAIVLMLDLILMISALFTTPNSITTWQTGADGEVRPRRLLEPLEAEGFRILHDRKIPRSRANIDHIVIGPPGVFVVETKSYSGSLSIRGDEVFVAGRRKNGWIDEVRARGGCRHRSVGRGTRSPRLDSHARGVPGQIHV